MMLFLQELKKTVFSLPYLLFTVVMIAGLYSQDVLNFSNSKMTEPQPGENYGVTNKEIPEIIMPAAFDQLLKEFCENNYRTYPIGLIKNVKLNDSEQMELAEIISDITGVDKDTVFKYQNNSSDNNYGDSVMVIGDNVQMNGNGEITVSPPEADSTDASEKDALSLKVRADMDYSKFKNLMQRIDDILGGGSDYSSDSLIGFGTVPLSYEEAVERYKLAVSYDKITGGYSRLFSDYAVAMVMSVLPVFLAVIMCLKDKRAGMSELIYTRGVSAVKIVTVRYFSLITAAMIPVIILSYISSASVWGMYNGADLDYLAPLKYDFGWIMPCVMISTAVGMCLTELTGTPVAVAVQGFWWLLDVNAGIQSVESSYSLFRLAPRHNAGAMSYFRTQDFIDNFNRLALNRLLFVGLAVILTVITTLIYKAKRKGKINGCFNFKKQISDIRNRKNKSEA